MCCNMWRKKGGTGSRDGKSCNIRKYVSNAIPIILILIFFVLLNLAFENYITENPVLELSGEEYLEREENRFSDMFESDRDYIEQKFIPQKAGLKTIGIRLAINHAGLTDDFRLLLELRREGKVIQSEEITQEEIDNWRYYDMELEEEPEAGEEYYIRIRQLVGPMWEGQDKYQISYVMFLAEEHVAENNTYYVYNGKRTDGEFEMYYVYSYSDDKLSEYQTAADLIFLLAAIALPLLKRFIKISEKAKDRIAAAMYLALPVLGFLTAELTAGNLWTMRASSMIKNLLMCYLAVLFLSLFIRRLGTLALICITGCSGLGLVQYFVLRFRGSAFMIQDIFAWKTAATVADRYIYEISLPLFLTLMTALYVIYVYQQVKRSIFPFRTRGILLLGTVCAAGLAGMITGGFLISPHKINVWDLTVAYQRDGSLLTMASEVQFLVGDRPATYSMDKIHDILEEARRTFPAESEAVTKPENLIVIMNESFADMENIGEIAADTALLPYLHSMEENVVRGWLSVPVFGGGTANTEYEVLTGNTMAFLSGGSPYQMNVSEGEFGLASVLKVQDFHTVAAHPYIADNWNRRTVYSDMGFDLFLSEENWGGLELMRWCESDEAAYRKVTELYEEQEGKLFIFLVTMQNHGGYSGEYDDFQNTVKLNYGEDYAQAEQYLSLLQESDRAFEGLVEYFSEVEEPTMIVMFGDHLATLENEFYDELFGKSPEELSFEEMQKRYITPFVIWANYEIEEDKDVIMSANYLGSYILKMAGLDMAPYQQFLYNLWKEVPVINIRGIMGNDGNWYPWDEVPEKYWERIEEYRILQYNNTYDRKNKVEGLFMVQER